MPLTMRKMPGALADLAKELLDIEATGNRERAEAWFKKYDVMPAELQLSLKAASKVPVDVDPVFSFPENQVRRLYIRRCCLALA